MSRHMSDPTKKHWTMASLPESEKVGRSAFLDKHILVDSNKKGKMVTEIPFPPENIGLYAVRFNANFSNIIASYGTGAIEVFDTTLEKPNYIVKPPSNTSFPIVTLRCSSYSPNIFYAAGICGKVYICKFQEDSYGTLAEEKSNEINAIDLDDKTETIATGGKDGAIRLYDTRVGKLILKLQKSNKLGDLETRSFHTKRIFSIKFHPRRPHIFLSGGWDDCVKIWDTRNSTGCVRNIDGPHMCGDALDVKENIVLTGQWTAENAIQTWDFGSGKLINNIVPTNRVQTLDGEFVYCCQYFKCNAFSDWVVSGGSGTTYLDVLNLNDERIVHSFKVTKLIQTLDTCEDTKVVFGGMDHCIRIATIILPEKHENP